MSAAQTVGPFAVLNPANHLLWNREARMFRGFLSGEFTRYASKAKAEQAIRRTPELRYLGLVAVPARTGLQP